MLFDILKIKEIYSDLPENYPKGILRLGKELNSNLLVCENNIATEVLKSDNFQSVNLVNISVTHDSDEKFLSSVLDHFSKTPLFLNGLKHIDARKKVLRLYELINQDLDDWIEDFSNKYIAKLDLIKYDPIFLVDDFIQSIFKKIIANQIKVMPEEIPDLPGELLNNIVPNKVIFEPINKRLGALNAFIESRYKELGKDPADAWALISVPVMGYEPLLASLVYGLLNAPKNSKWDENELLIKAAAVSLLIRFAKEDIELANFSFKKDQIIFVSPFLANFHDDFKKENSLEFGYGRKLCPGRKISIKITNKFFKAFYNNQKIKIQFENTLKERRNVLKFKHRKY